MNPLRYLLAVSSNDSGVLYIRKRGIKIKLIAGKGSLLSITVLTNYPPKFNGLRTTPPIYYIS